MEIMSYDLTQNQEQLSAVLNLDLQEKLGFLPTANKQFSHAIVNEDEWLAGATGSTNFTTFHLSLLAVKEQYLHLGYGSQLLQAAENFARENDCHLMTINTQDFQARSFYEKHGFTVFASLPDAPFVGTTRYYLMKKLK